MLWAATTFFASMQSPSWLGYRLHPIHTFFVRFLVSFDIIDMMPYRTYTYWWCSMCNVPWNKTHVPFSLLQDFRWTIFYSHFVAFILFSLLIHFSPRKDKNVLEFGVEHAHEHVTSKFHLDFARRIWRSQSLFNVIW